MHELSQINKPTCCGDVVNFQLALSTTLDMLVVVTFLSLFTQLVQAEEGLDDQVLTYKSPAFDQDGVYLAEHCDKAASDDMILPRWIKSKAKKDGTDAEISRYDGKWLVSQAAKHPLDGDRGLVLQSKARHAAISVPLHKQLSFLDANGGQKDVVFIQYEVNFQSGQECGGGYIKLLSLTPDLDEFTDKTPYSIMFGPDKCGKDAKVHLIFRFAVDSNLDEHHLAMNIC